MAGGGGRLKHFGLTFDTNAQQLSDALVDGQVDEGWAWIDLQADDGNAAAFYVGGDNTVASSPKNHGVRIPLPPSNVPALPYRIDAGGGAVYLRDVWVVGANNEVVNIFVCTR